MSALKTMVRVPVGIAMLTILLSGCLESEDSIESAVSPGPSPNSAPTISGTPPARVQMGESYSFEPSANDNDGDQLTFSINNRPGWASFDSGTGSLSGTPLLGDVGTFSGIEISVSDGSDSASLGAFSITVEDAASDNTPPAILGTPATTVAVGATYLFQPTASDADGDSLTFSIQNQPGWASFDASTGSLSGTPPAGSEGNYANIVISVSDGMDSTGLSPFAIQVTQIGTGSVTLSWTAPTQNDDGTPLMDLAGFRVRYGTAPNNYTQMIQIDNAGVTTYVVDNLSPGTYYFVSTAFTTQNVESINSNEVSRVVN